MSASNRVQYNEITSTVMKYLNNYRENIQDDVVEVTDNITAKAREELIQKSPRSGRSRKNPYYRGWTVKVSTRGATKYHKVIWNRTNYQLTHLLEFGHIKSNGTGWVNPSPAGGHIRPVEEKYKVEFVDLIEERIRRGGK